MKSVPLEMNVAKRKYTVQHGSIEEAVLLPASASSSVEELHKTDIPKEATVENKSSGGGAEDALLSPKSKKASGLQAFVDRARGRSSPNRAKADKAAEKATRRRRKMDRAKTVHGDEAHAERHVSEALESINLNDYECFMIIFRSADGSGSRSSPKFQRSNSEEDVKVKHGSRNGSKKTLVRSVSDRVASIGRDDPTELDKEHAQEVAIDTEEYGKITDTTESPDKAGASPKSNEEGGKRKRRILPRAFTFGGRNKKKEKEEKDKEKEKDKGEKRSTHESEEAYSHGAPHRRTLALSL